MPKALVIGPDNLLRSATVNAIQQAGGEALACDPTHPDLPNLVRTADFVLPTTLELPESLDFPVGASLCGSKYRQLFTACQDLHPIRQWVQQQTGHQSGNASFWLPLILTAKGILYGEAIAAQADGTYLQPLNLTDKQRQPLYQLGFQLLQQLQATPAVYLMGATYQGTELFFDRLLPFPDIPALAAVQQPDLLTCHWLCHSRQPILDITIPSTAKYLELS
jgi:hypothetical protein